ncbi:MAG: LysR family transcriptional regulator [Rhodoblastus sp.]
MKKYDDLLVFVTVVDRQSFIGAARQLNLPPGTVSRKVQELETRLGITLAQPHDAAPVGDGSRARGL